MFTWLLVQITAFYAFIAWGLGHFREYLCHYKRKKEEVMLALDDHDKTEGLLSSSNIR